MADFNLAAEKEDLQTAKFSNVIVGTTGFFDILRFKDYLLMRTEDCRILLCVNVPGSSLMNKPLPILDLPTNRPLLSPPYTHSPTNIV